MVLCQRAVAAINNKMITNTTLPRAAAYLMSGVAMVSWSTNCCYYNVLRRSAASPRQPGPVTFHLIQLHYSLHQPPLLCLDQQPLLCHCELCSYTETPDFNGEYLKFHEVSPKPCALCKPPFCRVGKIGNFWFK